MPDGAVVTMAGLTAASGAVALLAGLVGLQGIRRLRRVGVDVWALVKRAGPTTGEDGVRPLLQYETGDGLVVEVGSPAPPSKRHPLVEGSLVRVTYDPDDPRVLQLHGRERATLEYAMVGTGAVFIMVGAGLLLG